MKPVYIDLHIHTSDNPDKLNERYDLDKLITNIKKISKENEYLISLTDHNTINKEIYLKAIKEHINILLGTELHIKNSEDKPAYHCHIYFNVLQITSETIDDINKILNVLYPVKQFEKINENIPHIEKIIDSFENYEFVLIPHGGQSHATFEKSISNNSTCDSTIERTIYYNQIEGFSARTNIGIEKTINYFKKLGIDGFVNLITGSDNYNPTKYPNAKSENTTPFMPTWMYSMPTFQGLRMSLSEESRLEYNDLPTYQYKESIEAVKLNNDKIVIDVKLTSGLNVIIGESSSGKSLFIDSIYKKIVNNFSESDYLDFGVEDLDVENKMGTQPYYINQNFISDKILKNRINEIPIIKNMFPDDKYNNEEIEEKLVYLKKLINQLILAVKNTENKLEEINKIPTIKNLIVNNNLDGNLFKLIKPNNELIKQLDYSQKKYEKDVSNIEEIAERINKNLFGINLDEKINDLKNILKEIYMKNNFEKEVRNIIINSEKLVIENSKVISKENKDKIKNKESLKKHIEEYIVNLENFRIAKENILEFNYKVATVENNYGGNKLFISNKLSITKEMLKEIMNNLLKNEYKIQNFDNLTVYDLFLENFLKKADVLNYDYIEDKIFSMISKKNIKEYKIISEDGKDFENTSPGWKTAIILDIILKYENDNAPLIIDQPEDNLANTYINNGFIKQIKEAKKRRQIIMVSHNATIPMLGDAQNIIICKNENNKIKIFSKLLEENIDENITIIDYIAEITDGGKKSIKKRFKKYNFKKYKECVFNDNQNN